jgi:hypothetical protein
MADPRYEIDWAPPNLGPAIALFQAARNQHRQNERSDEYMQMERDAIKARSERESAALAREKAEADRKHAIEAYSAMPALQRAALKSVPQANTNPYGVHFDETMEPPDQGKADAAVGGFLASDQPPEQASAPARQLMPTEEGPEQAPEAETARFASPDDLMSKATGGAPLDMMSQAAANSFGPATRHVRGNYAGQQFEVNPQSETSGFGEKWDAMFNALVEGGEEPHKARAFIAAQAKQEMADTARDKHLADAIAGRNANREDQQTFLAGENAKYRNEGLTFEQRKELMNIMARAKMASAGAAPVSPGVAKLVGMKEAGASDEEIYSEAAKLKLSQKDVAAPVQNVVKNAAAGERAGQKREALVATGEGTNPGDMWKSPQAATKGTQQIQRFHRVKERMQALIEHIKKYGERIDPDAQQYQDRMSLSEAAAAALRPYNELSSTDASMAAERAILGPAGAFGHGWTLGANLQGLERILAEAEGQQKTNLATMLRPGGGSQLAPALGGPRGGAHPDALKAKAQRALDDPNAPPEAKEAARTILGQ